MTEAKPPRPRTLRVGATVRDGASRAVDATSTTARDLARKTAAGIEANPVAVLAGGVALGVLAGAFVPRSAQEAKLLGPVGRRLTDTARGAAEAAKGTAKSELDILGLTRNAARDQVGKLLGDIVKALSTAGAAALTATKTPLASAPAEPVPAAPAKKRKPKA